VSATLKEVAAAFEHVFETMHDPGFRKSIRLSALSERQLLRYTKFFLLGWFGRTALEVERTVAFPWTETGKGRVDFSIGEVAIEVAVRNPTQGPSTLLSRVNAPEMVKLIKHRGPAMLVLFDFSRSPLSDADLEAYRDVPSLGQGNHARSPFNVYYFNKKRGRREAEERDRSEFSPVHKRILV
jgi:hypothetical protein